MKPNHLSSACLFLFFIVTFSLQSQVDTIHVRKRTCMTINGKSWVYGADSSIIVDKKLLLGMSTEEVKKLLGTANGYSSFNYTANGWQKSIWTYITNTCETGDDLFRRMNVEFKSDKVIKSWIER
jgi:hypothetical protein